MNDWSISLGLLILLLVLVITLVWRVRRQFHRRPRPKPIAHPTSPRRILVISAHPDDLRMACGGTLMRMYREGHILHGLILNRISKNAPQQPGLQKANSKELIDGLNELTYVDLPDTSFSNEMEHIRQEIEKKVRSFGPEIILTPSEHDQHPEHQLIHYATMQASQQVYTILCYESLTATAEFKPTLFVEIGDYLDDKIENLRSQTALMIPPSVNRLDIYIQTHIRAHARTRGEQARTAYAEGFEIRRALMIDGVTF